jgi:hypothetical protein
MCVCVCVIWDICAASNMCACMSVCMYVCMYMKDLNYCGTITPRAYFMDIHPYVYVYACILVRIYAYIHTCICTHAPRQDLEDQLHNLNKTLRNMCTCVIVCMYVCICICMHTLREDLEDQLHNLNKTLRNLRKDNSEMAQRCLTMMAETSELEKRYYVYVHLCVCMCVSLTTMAETSET